MLPLTEHQIAAAVSARARQLKRSVEILWTTTPSTNGHTVIAFAREQVCRGSVLEVKVWARVEGERDIARAARLAATALAERDPNAGWPAVE